MKRKEPSNSMPDASGSLAQLERHCRRSAKRRAQEILNIGNALNMALERYMGEGARWIKEARGRRRGLRAFAQPRR